MSDRLLEAMQERLEGGQLPCNQAFSMVQALGVTPMEVGQKANEAGIRISRCQLGLFGYGPKAEGKHKIVHAMDSVPERLAARLREVAWDDAAMRCDEVWAVADALGFRRLEASSALEAMGIKVSHCQLGCFPRP